MLQRFKGFLCPRVQAKLEENKNQSRIWVAQWVGDPKGEKYEVECKPELYTVNLGAHTCSCRSWDLCGIPCPHAVAAMGWRHLKPEDFVHPSLTKDTFAKVYEPYIQPINGQSLWQPVQGDEVHPPTMKKKCGRQKVQRRKDPVEAEQSKDKSTTKLRRQLVHTCRRCGTPGHTRKTCKLEYVGEASGHL